MTEPASRPTTSAGLRFFFQTPLDWLLLAVPVAFGIRFVPAWKNDSLLFVAAGIGIIPLAGWLGRATEQLSARAGAGIGGFLNATFGNAAELIIALMALSKGLTTVVKASLTGSIIGNLLLVLGASAFAGGLRFPRQRFNETAARAHVMLPTEATSPLFEAALEATEEAVYNSLFQATSVRSAIGAAEAIPIDKVKELLAK